MEEKPRDGCINNEHDKYYSSQKAAQIMLQINLYLTFEYLVKSEPIF